MPTIKCEYENCRKEFHIEAWDSGRRYCSQSCSSKDNCGHLELARSKINHKNILITKGQILYSEVEYTEAHKSSFHNMIKRCSDSGLECDFKKTTEDFRKFIEVIGPVPDNMIRPSVGRYNHDIGYIIGNFRWQELKENIAEGSRRRWEKYNNGT